MSKAMSRLPQVANAHRKRYVSDLSDAEWELLADLLPAPKGFGPPRTVDLREIVNGVFYVQRTGCQWEMMPHDLPPHETVYKYFRKWQRQGVWQRIHERLREQIIVQSGHTSEPQAVIVDSQSVKTTEKRGRSTALMVARKLKDVSAMS